MAAQFIPRFLSSQLFGKVPYPTADFSGQTIIVTGSYTGLGFEAAQHIARLGAAKVILGVRTTTKGEAAADLIAKTIDVPRSRLEVWELAMNDAESIKAFAKRAAQLPRLDAALLNAGILNQSSWTFLNDVEAHIAVNVIGTMLLAHLLLPVLQQSARKTLLRGRLAIVGSDMMMMANPKDIDVSGAILPKLNDIAGRVPSQDRYALSKLLVKYSVGGLAERNPLVRSNVIITDLTPGMCVSDIFREEAGFFVRTMIAVVSATMAHSTERGSRSLVYGVEPDLPEGAHGAFLWDNKPLDPGNLVTGEEGTHTARKWNEELLREMERLAPGCTTAS